MLYKLAHLLRDHFPFLWDLVDIINAFLFVLRYWKRLKNLSAILQKYSESYNVIPISECDTNELASFFAHQPEEAYTFFHPHGFDAKSIKKLQRNKSFLAFVLKDKQNGNIAGYCFNRSFFHGKGFRGRMVDINYRGKGLGTMTNKILNDVGFSIGLHLYETVNKDNIASYKSALSASNVKVLQELEDGDLYLEILPE